MQGRRHGLFTSFPSPPPQVPHRFRAAPDTPMLHHSLIAALDSAKTRFAMRREYQQFAPAPFQSTTPISRPSPNRSSTRPCKPMQNPIAFSARTARSFPGSMKIPPYSDDWISRTMLIQRGKNPKRNPKKKQIEERAKNTNHSTFRDLGGIRPRHDTKLVIPPSCPRPSGIGSASTECPTTAMNSP